MITVHPRSVVVTVPLPDGVQTHLIVEAFEDRPKRRNRPRIRRQVLFLHSRHKMRGTVHVQRQRNIRRQTAIRIPLRGVALIKLAQRRARGFGFLRFLQNPLHLSPHIAPRRIRDSQVLVISAGVERRQHGKERFAAIELDRSGTLLPDAA